MTLVDANVLLYVVNAQAEHHAASRAWMRSALRSGRPVGLAWLALTAFIRLSTKVGLFPAPLDVSDATGIVRSWVDHPATLVLEPTARHAGVLAGLLQEVGTGGNLVNDAHLAAIAVEHDAEVVSYDNDFSRFTGVRWSIPSAG
ncbi:MAG: type II toxin-antitoxin system VapC family toxin [Actinobacteria bacterium]|nr:type II toxin-antitoxin system VapC family toxin [Actinomycetota bacterium]